MKGNMKDMCMHLTNYAINKRSDTFVRSTDGTTGSKRRLTYIKSYLASQGHDVSEVCWSPAIHRHNVDIANRYGGESRTL